MTPCMLLCIVILTGIMPPDSTTEYDLHLQNAVRDMEDLKDDLSSDAFFLFCPANVPSEEEMDNIVHPKTIKEDLEKKHFKWYNGTSLLYTAILLCNIVSMKLVVLVTSLPSGLIFKAN